jgi:hypothetical protein
VSGRFTPGKDPVPIVQEAGWAPGSVWSVAENVAPPAFDPRTVQPVACRYTYAIPCPYTVVYLYIYCSIFVYIRYIYVSKSGCMTSYKGMTVNSKIKSIWKEAFRHCSAGNEKKNNITQVSSVQTAFRNEHFRYISHGPCTALVVGYASSTSAHELWL